MPETRGGRAVDVASYEQAVEQSAAGLEREAMRRLLQARDVDAPHVLIHGKPYTRVGRYEAPYETKAGPVRVVRSVYRQDGERTSKTADAVSLRAGVVEDDVLDGSLSTRWSCNFDVFGTRRLYPTAASGRTWSAKWSTNPRTLSAGQTDPYDPEFQMRGSSHTLRIPGDGSAMSSGDTIRFYLSSPGKTWHNTELTVYARRVSEQSDADSSTGFEFQTRSADGHTSSTSSKNAEGLPLQCDGHSYGYSLRYDGRALFEKELRHPTYTSQVSKNIWNGGSLPRNQWIGIKVITYNLPDGRVKLELWRDLSDGLNGGSWEKVHEYADAGGWSISPAL